MVCNCSRDDINPSAHQAKEAADVAGAVRVTWQVMMVGGRCIPITAWLFLQPKRNVVPNVLTETVLPVIKQA